MLLDLEVLFLQTKYALVNIYKHLIAVHKGFLPTINSF